MHDETTDHDHDPVQDQPVPEARTAGSFDMPTHGGPVPSEDDPAGHDDHRRVTPLRSGVAMMLVGAMVLLVGMVSTTAASGGGNAACPDGTQLVAKFEFRGGTYVFEKPSGNQDVVVISDADARGGVWASEVPIAAIVVKGGPGSKTTTLEPPQGTGTFSNTDLPPVGQGNTPDISNIQFCGPTTPPPTSTTSASTTSTTSTTSTSTSTTIAPTSTTIAPTSTVHDQHDHARPARPARPSRRRAPSRPPARQHHHADEHGPDDRTAPTTTAPTTTAIGPTSIVAPTTTGAPTTTTTDPQVQGSVVIQTKVTPDDAAVSAGGASRVLAYTGGSSTILVDRRGRPAPRRRSDRSGGPLP